MKNKVIRFVGALIVGISSSLLATMYNHVMYHNFVEHGQMALPILTDICTKIAPFAISVPVICLITGLISIKKKFENILEIASQISLVFGIIWPVLLIVLWEIPQILL